MGSTATHVSWNFGSGRGYLKVVYGAELCYISTMCSANKYSFTSFQYKCLLFSCLVALTRTSLNRTTWNRSSKSRHSCLVPNLGGKIQFLIIRMMLATSLMPFISLRKFSSVPLYFCYYSFPPTPNHEGILNFVNFFLVSIKIVMWFLPLFC